MFHFLPRRKLHNVDHYPLARIQSQLFRQFGEGMFKPDPIRQLAFFHFVPALLHAAMNGHESRSKQIATKVGSEFRKSKYRYTEDITAHISHVAIKTNEIGKFAVMNVDDTQLKDEQWIIGNAVSEHFGILLPNKIRCNEISIGKLAPEASTVPDGPLPFLRATTINLGRLNLTITS